LFLFSGYLFVIYNLQQRLNNIAAVIVVNLKCI
jgi:hypothetical protein